MATHESLIEKIQALPEEALEKVEDFVDTLYLEQAVKFEEKRPLFGSARHLITYIAEDFNEPLDDLKEYM